MNGRTSMAAVALRKIVLTGGPGAGKTVVAMAAVERLGERFVLVPEAATHIYNTLNTRWNRLDTAGRRDVQTRMYQWQLQQENATAAAHPGRVMLLDRGTIDGAAYWPDGHDAFWPAMGTTRQAELGRYDAVIILETAAALGVYDGAASNDVRFESPSEAIRSGELLVRLWDGHPHVRHVPAYPRLQDKIDHVVRMVRELVEPAA